jgi:predicted transcriptional regulator
VETVLASAKEAIEERYRLKARGIDFAQVVFRVAEVLKITPDQVTAYGKSPRTVQARSLLCFWAHRKLGMTTTAIARQLKISQPAASRSSKRGEQIGKEYRFELIDIESM